MKKISYSRFIWLLVVAVLGACSDDNDPATPTLSVPATYESANFDANVTAERTVRTELAQLRTDLNAIEAAAIDSIFSNGPITFPSNLQAVTLGTYASRVSAWLTEVRNAANSGLPFDLENAPSGEGGILGTRLLDENGMEYEQLIDKGLQGAALYNHALTVINNATLSANDIDKLVEIFGAHPTFPGDDSDPNFPDDFAAEYAERRSNNTAGTGLYYDIRNNLIIAKAALEEGSTFQTVTDSVLNEFKLNWEKSNFATVIYYCNDAQSKLASAAQEADSVAQRTLLGNALHSYSEAVGFTFGWLELSDKQITDTQILDILAFLLVDPDAAPDSYQFTNDASLLTNFDSAIDLIQSVYGFSEAEVNGFFVNN